MRVLVLGGTVFVGRHLVAAALARGHEVTLFNRGRQNPELFPELEKLRGNRESDLSRLAGRRFDAVIDPSGFTPAHLRASAGAIDMALYAFVSSISVYGSYPPGRGYDETASIAPGEEGYGPEKARAEEALLAALPDCSLILRPGLVVGPHDPTDRFTYWPRRVAASGEVLAPGRPERPVQFVDVRDLAGWTVRALENGVTGTYNVVTPPGAVTMADVLEASREASGSDARFTWLDDDTLVAADVESWSELPLWIPESDEKYGGMMLANSSRAVAAGLTFRPLLETARDTLAWDRAEGAQPTERPLRVTPLAREREAELLGGG